MPVKLASLVLQKIFSEVVNKGEYLEVKNSNNDNFKISKTNSDNKKAPMLYR